MSLTGKIFNIQKFSLHDGPGIRTTVFFKGCPLECQWCSNPESQNRFAYIADVMDDKAFCGKTYTVDEVLKEVIKDKPFYDQSGGGMTLSGGEVLQQSSFAMALADEAKKQGVHVAVETTGLTSKNIFQEFVSHIDLLLFDFKHHNNEKHKIFTGVSNEGIQENLQYALSHGIAISVRIPVIPGFNDSIEDAKNISSYLFDIGAKVVHLLPFHQFGEKKYERLGVVYEMQDIKQLHPEDLEEYKQVFTDVGLICTFE